jgi:hypothetical protein
MSSPTSYDIELFPTPAESTPSGQAPSGTGVCFSGGGSRALTAALGALRGLTALGLMEKVSFISSVSGGTWAAAAYTYLPATISDDDFLGPVVEPAAITASGLKSLPPNNLGLVPGRLGFTDLFATITELKVEHDYPDDYLWQGIIGKYMLEPFGLWNQNFKGGYPSQYYSGTSADAVIARNPELSAAQFYLIERPRPTLIMNGSMYSNSTTDKSQLLPFESTPASVGVRMPFTGEGPGGRDIGGGTIENFGMGSTWQLDQPVNPPEAQASVSIPARPFSLSDMVSISSAAFAQVIEKLHDLIGLDPQYLYWPVAGRENPKNAAYSYTFADGGLLENTGVASMLSRQVPNVIAFVNSETPLSMSDGEIVVDSQIPLLFGVQPSPKSLLHKEPKREDVPNQDLTFVQVFPESSYQALAQGLWNANSAGGPAMFVQTLQTVANPNFGVPVYTVNVLWVYNTAVQNWFNLLQPDVQSVVKETKDFPNYNTIWQLELNPTEVNLLADLSCWNVMSNAAMVKGMFGG